MQIRKQSFDKKEQLERELREIYRQEELIKLQRKKEEQFNKASEYDYGVSQYDNKKEFENYEKDAKQDPKDKMMISLIIIMIIILILNSIMIGSSLYWIRILGA